MKTSSAFSKSSNTESKKFTPPEIVIEKEKVEAEMSAILVKMQEPGVFGDKKTDTTVRRKELNPQSLSPQNRSIPAIQLAAEKTAILVKMSEPGALGNISEEEYNQTVADFERLFEEIGFPSNYLSRFDHYDIPLAIADHQKTEKIIRNVPEKYRSICRLNAYISWSNEESLRAVVNACRRIDRGVYETEDIPSVLAALIYLDGPGAFSEYFSDCGFLNGINFGYQ